MLHRGKCKWIPPSSPQSQSGQPTPTENRCSAFWGLPISTGGLFETTAVWQHLSPLSPLPPLHSTKPPRRSQHSWSSSTTSHQHRSSLNLTLSSISLWRWMCLTLGLVLCFLNIPPLTKSFIHVPFFTKALTCRKKLTSEIVNCWQLSWIWNNGATGWRVLHFHSSCGQIIKTFPTSRPPNI